MSNPAPENLPIIEVPAELRGLSDEEILALHPFDPEKRDRFRPSKKERAKRKLAREQARIRQIAEQYKNRNSYTRYASRPMPKLSDFDSDRPHPTTRLANSSKKTLFVPGQMKKFPTAAPAAESKQTATPLPPRQSSGRVLVGSFGGAKFNTAKTQIISESELAKQAAVKKAKAEEQTKENLLKAQESLSGIDRLNALFSAPAVEGAAPVKRKRGRPRKNPLPETP